MKISGELTVPAPQAAVFEAVQDARFFASCIDGVQELTEVDPTHYDAVLETKVAYMKFRFKLSVEVTRKEPPDTIEAKVEGTPLGIVGRITATSVTRLSQVGDETRIAYEIDAAITGKLGSLGQPVLKSKAKDMEKQFSSRLREKFSPASSGAAS
ncbi:MAG TPA: carbon monoxide dehydrogenase subunit G [Pseudolabrys sp.]|jgi:carbon monoxide dehydrogenase subunit G|uniref:CoxG family protein n=1 Tax=Pseudolabrys sp. TaxID=1960880 RepID=UPI002DDD4527|nr:carbon monoxide dehydrogenase subunit G [Pseudolabrys sp.]HEV2630156.1 carbon monoxide dehydrogenase subunit G [Pseudolabrys sp.]